MSSISLLTKRFYFYHNGNEAVLVLVSHVLLKVLVTISTALRFALNRIFEKAIVACHRISHLCFALNRIFEKAWLHVIMFLLNAAF